VVRIDPATARVSGWVLLDGLLERVRAAAGPGGAAGIDVLNGIAWDAASGRLFVTGKQWPHLYEIKLVEAASDAAAVAAARQRCLPKVFDL